MRLATLCWLPSKACKIMPLAVNFPIGDQESRILPNTTQTWFLLVKRGATHNFAAFVLCTAQALHFRQWSLAAVPKLSVIVA